MNVVLRLLAPGFLLLVAPLFGLERASAATIALTATDAGFVTEVGGSAKGDGTLTPGATYNYSAGRELHYGAGALLTPLTPMDRKNYFVFDLSTVPGPISSATLKLYAGPGVPPAFPGGAHGYESFDPSETYGIAATTDPIGALADIGALAFGNTIGPSEFDSVADPLIGMAVALYGKLASGPTPLAFAVISPLDDGTTLSLAFLPAGIAYLNSFLGAPVVLGGKVPTAIPPASPQSVFGFTGPDLAGGDPLAPLLEITYVPEPATGLLTLVGLLALGVRQRAPRRKL